MEVQRPGLRLRRLIANVGLRNKLLSMHILLLLTACTAVMVFSFHVFRQYEDMLYENVAQVLNMSMYNIERDLLDVERLTESMALDPVFQSAFQMPDDAKRSGLPNARKREPTSSYNIAAVEVMQSLSGYLSRNSDQISVSIYVDDQRFLSSADRSEEPALARARALAGAASGRMVWLPSGRDDGSLLCARDLKGLRNMGMKTLGLILVRVNLRQIVSRNLIKNENLIYAPQIAIFADDDSILFGDLAKTAAPLPAEMRYGVQGDSFISRTSSANFSWKYALYVPFEQVLGAIARQRAAAVAVLTLTIALSAAAFALAVSHIVRHLSALVAKMEQFKQGQELSSACDYSARRDELGYLHRSFDQMALDFKQLIEDNYVKQILIRDAQILSLRQQINPHFYFNILQTINWKAKACGQREISEIVEALGRLARYSTATQRELMTLGEEVEVARDYTSIQRYRYGERLDVCFDVPAAFAAVLVPRMTVQSIVENAVKHALEAMLTPCHIQVSARRRGDLLTLSVEDNGPGIDETILDSPPERLQSEVGLGIGLHNLRRRAKLLLSEDCEIELRNTGHGSIVTILLPIGGAAEEAACDV